MTARRSLALLLLLASCAGPPIAVPEAERLSPDQQEAYRDAVRAWIDEDDAATRELLEPLAALEPWYVPAHTLRQDTLLREGRGEEARAWYADAAARRPDDAARVLLAGRLAERDAGRREAAYRRARTLAPDAPWPALALGIELTRAALAERQEALTLEDGGFSERAGTLRAASEDRRRESRDLLEGVVERFSDLPDVLAGAAEAYLLLGESLGDRAALERARSLAASAAERDPGRPARHALLARAARALLEDEAAEAALRRALELDPDDPDLLAGLGRVLLDLGRPDEARSALREALAARPDDAVVALDLGVAAHRTGALDAAADRFRQAADLDPTLAEAYRALALLEIERGDRVAARRALRAYVGRGGAELEWAESALRELSEQGAPGP